MSRHNKRPSVCFGYISPGQVSHEFAQSLLSMTLRYSEQSRKVIRAYVALQSGPRISEARSQVVDNFAKTHCDWLLMVDADMRWDDDALDKLLEVADEHTSPIVGGLCFGGRSDSEIFPTIYRLIQVDDVITTEIVHDYPTDAVVECSATGAAFLLVHKRVFAEMKAAFGKLPNGKPNPYPWFLETANGGIPFGEDIAFCIKAQSLGMSIKVHTGVKIGHIKTTEYTEKRYQNQQWAKVEAKHKSTTALSLP